jgi:Ca2+-binding RTX toxin-like protein
MRSCEVAMSKPLRLVKSSLTTLDTDAEDLAVNLTIADGRQPIPTRCALSAGVPAVMADASPITRIAAAPPTLVRTSATLTQVLYLQETGDNAIISVHDINQGQIGDCFLLSAIGEIALFHSSAIMNMINVNADGTETVTLYLAASGLLPTFGTTSFKPVTVTVSNVFPSYAVNNGATQDVSDGQKEIWVQVLEKAVATLNGGYNGIANGGNPMIAMEELVGQSTTWMSPAALSLQALQGYIAAGDLIVMDTPASSSLPYGLVGGHAYMFESLTVVGGTPMVQLGNPWGFNQPSLIPLSQLSRGIAEVDIGQFVTSNIIIGGPGNDTKTLTSPIVNGSIDLGAGQDMLILADGTNSATVANTETIIGGSGDDTIVVATPAVGTSIDLRGGNDKLTFGNFTNTATVANVETIIGGSGNDTITLASALTNAMQVDLGSGSNQLVLAAGGTGTISNVSILIGSAGNDNVTFATPLSNGSVDLGGGSDRLALAAGGNRLSVANVETLLGGSGADVVTLTTAAANTSIDLGAGNDTLYFGNFSNMANVANTETIIGGSGNDTITLATALTPGMLVDLGGGTNKLMLANGGNSGTVRNVGTLIGGTGADVVTLGTPMINGSVDLGGGSDTLTLANATNSVTVMNTETIIGGTGNDTIVLNGNAASLVIGGGGMNFITGNAAADTFVFDQNSSSSVTKVMNFSTMNGDKIALDTKASNVLGHDTYDLGGTPLALNIDLVDVANTTARLKTNLANHGKGGFAFEQDNGQLYYSSNGSFAGGGTLIGVITTDGTHPWAFNASSFIQV